MLSLFNGLVLPHLQFCLMVWGDFEGCGNVTWAGLVLCHQKGFARLVAGVRGRPNADPFLAWHGMLKVGDHYRQQLRVYLAFLEWEAPGKSGSHAQAGGGCPWVWHKGGGVWVVFIYERPLLGGL